MKIASITQNSNKLLSLAVGTLGVLCVLPMALGAFKNEEPANCGKSAGAPSVMQEQSSCGSPTPTPPPPTE